MAFFTIFVIFLLLLAILGLGSWIGLALHRRLSIVESENRRMRLAAIEDAQQSESLIDDLKTRIEAAERRASDSLQRPLQSINYSQRSQMLRMIRRGDSADQIASALEVSLSQVRLLMKLPGVAPESIRAPAVGRAKAQAAGE
ncbi:MAG TPA: hypothetical protein VGL53_31405 [Bryobacteraceae bacterium]|jgi:hypothetical protein